MLAITQAICDFRRGLRHHGAALHRPRHARAVRAGVQDGPRGARGKRRGRHDRLPMTGYTPTPAISHAILTHNRGRTVGRRRRHRHHAVAQSARRRRLQVQPADRRSGRDGSDAVDRGPRQPVALERFQTCPAMAYEKARRAATTHAYDYVGSYVNDLGAVVDLDVIRRRGAQDRRRSARRREHVAYWQSIVDRCGIEVEVVNDSVDPTFGFMPLDWDGKIRMDCSSPHAMATLIGLKDRFDIAFGNDADADRHGVVTRRRADESESLPGGGDRLPLHASPALAHRCWRSARRVVSSSVIDRVAAKVGRPLVEVPVGFKWFVPGLLDGSLGFGGEESAGRLVPAARRHGVVDRQGRHHHGPARGGAHGAHGPRSVRAVRRSDRARSVRPV